MRASAWLPPVLTILFSKADGLAPPTVPWLACASAVEVNRAVEQHVRPGDGVVEMGSQLKETSRLICDAVGATGTALLCDVARKSPRVSTSRNANFRRGDDLQSVPPQATWIELESFDGWRCAPALDASFKGASAPCDVLDFKPSIVSCCVGSSTTASPSKRAWGTTIVAVSFGSLGVRQVCRGTSG